MKQDYYIVLLVSDNVFFLQKGDIWQFTFGIRELTRNGDFFDGTYFAHRNFYNLHHKGIIKKE